MKNAHSSSFLEPNERKKEPLDVLTPVMPRWFNPVLPGQRPITKRHMGSQRIKRLRSTNLALDYFVVGLAELLVLAGLSKGYWREHHLLTAV